MGKVVAFKRPSLEEKAKGKTLCSNGFHQWTYDNKKQFDVKSGKLVTVYQCRRCGVKKNKAH